MVLPGSDAVGALEPLCPTARLLLPGLQMGEGAAVPSPVLSERIQCCQWSFPALDFTSLCSAFPQGQSGAG